MIVALHGLLDSPRGYEEIARHVDLLAPRVPQNRHSLQSRADWLQGWIEKENLEDFDLLGHSLGGALCASVAEKVPARSLLLLAPAGFGPMHLAHILEGPLGWPLRRSGPTLLHISPLVRTVYRHLFTSGSSLPTYLQKELQRDPEAVLRRAQREMHIVAELHERPLRNLSYQGPVSALWGERDHLVPSREGRDVLRVFPEAHISVLPGIGHDLLREAPDAVAEWIQTTGLDAHSE